MKRLRATHAETRQAISLLEVLLATAIFSMSLVAILNLMNLGHDSRLSARLDAEATLRCEQIMGELISGYRDMSSETEQAFDDSDEWVYTTTIEDGPGESLLMVTVLVEHQIQNGQNNAYFQITRFIRDPQMFIDAQTSSAESSE